MGRVAACQLPLNIENQRSNIEIAIAATVKAAADGANIVLPELLNSGYAFKNCEEARALAITIDQSVFNHFTQIAKTRDAIIVGGFVIPMEVVRLQSAASVNKMVAIAADRTGSERGTDWVSASAITDCDGVIKAMAD